MSFIQRLLIAIVHGYRWFLSPWLGSACRFTPTCSLYALQALTEHGAACGTYLSARRLLRCHPWCDGGDDPVSLSRTKQTTLFTSLVSIEKTHP